MEREIRREIVKRGIVVMRKTVVAVVAAVPAAAVTTSRNWGSAEASGQLCESPQRPWPLKMHRMQGSLHRIATVPLTCTPSSVSFRMRLSRAASSVPLYVSNST